MYTLYTLVYTALNIYEFQYCCCLFIFEANNFFSVLKYFHEDSRKLMVPRQYCYSAKHTKLYCPKKASILHKLASIP